MRTTEPTYGWIKELLEGEGWKSRFYPDLERGFFQLKGLHVAYSSVQEQEEQLRALFPSSPRLRRGFAYFVAREGTELRALTSEEADSLEVCKVNYLESMTRKNGKLRLSFRQDLYSHELIGDADVKAFVGKIRYYI